MTGKTALVALSVVVGITLILLGTSAAMPDLVRIPSVRPRPAGPPGAVFFHSGHANFMCHNCHPALFPSARVGFTHDDFAEGRFCANCHDGKAAWAITGADCERCHVAP